jgi:hypothetical protein
MTNLSKAFGKKFDADSIRIRSFEFNNHTFKVKVPLTAEFESIMEEVQKVDEAKVNKYYEELGKTFVDQKENLDPSLGVVFEDNDIKVQGRSLKETAKNKAITENRILAMFKFLVPEEKDFNMSTITYDMVEELFPFSVQLEMVELIANVISPNYKDAKGK